jgi:hypothetical protein
VPNHYQRWSAIGRSATPPPLVSGRMAVYHTGASFTGQSASSHLQLAKTSPERRITTPADIAHATTCSQTLLTEDSKQ